MSDDTTRYGLPSVRDRDGNLKPVDYTFTYRGEEVTVRIVPPTAAEVDQYESLDDPTATHLAEIVCNHIVKPDYDDPEELTMAEITCYSQGILTFHGGDGADELADALDERLGETGN